MIANDRYEPSVELDNLSLELPDKVVLAPEMSAFVIIDDEITLAAISECLLPTALGYSQTKPHLMPKFFNSNPKYLSKTSSSHDVSATML